MGIYKITNLINGMCYIGQSTDIRKRWWAHKTKTFDTYLSRAIKKYGKENFSFELLRECSIHELDELEKKYIHVFNSIRPNGYNLEGGGNKSKTVDRDVVERVASANRKPVSQYTLNGKFIKTYISIQEAANENRLTCSLISACLHGKQKMSGGYQWRLGKNKSTILPYKKNSDRYHHTKNRIRFAVNQYTKDGKYINTFDSASDVGKYLNKDYSSITACCKGNLKTAYGYQWRYADVGKRDIKPVQRRNDYQHLEKRVFQFTKDGKCIKMFNSIKNASKETGICASGISNCLCGKYQTSGGFVWKLIDG